MRARSALVLASAAGLLAGCGGGAGVDDGAPAGHRPTAREAERLLDSSFRQGLRRLAVMTQPGDDPTDLGQPLPTGLVRATRCSAGAGRCAVRWQTVDGRPRRTAYVVEVTDRGCLYASAHPALPQVRDATTEAPAESPLGFLVATVPGC